MNKSMNTLNDHAHMRIGTCRENDQDASKYVPRQRTTMRYQEMRLMHN